MNLDLGTILNLISTLTLIGALIFTGLQLRASNRTRREQAAITVIQSAQSEAWTQASDVIHRARQTGDEDADAEGVDRNLELALFTVGIRLEAIGYMVFERLVDLSTVDELMGGFTLIFWSRAEAWVKRRRRESADPKAFEWCEWLAMRIADRRANGRSQPAYLRQGWKD
jgi:hypothetical protein